MKLILLIIIIFTVNLFSEWNEFNYNSDELNLKFNDITHVRPSINEKDLIVQTTSFVYFVDIASGTITNTYDLKKIIKHSNSYLEERTLLSLDEKFISSVLLNENDTVYSYSYNLTDSNDVKRSPVLVQSPDFRIAEYKKFKNIYAEDGSYYNYNAYFYVNARNISLNYGTKLYKSTTSINVSENYRKVVRYLDPNVKCNEKNGDYLYLNDGKIERVGEFSKTFSSENIESFEFGIEDNTSIIITSYNQIKDNKLSKITRYNHVTNDIDDIYYKSKGQSTQIREFNKLNNDYFYSNNGIDYSDMKYLGSISLFDVNTLRPVNEIDIDFDLLVNSINLFYFNGYFYFWGEKNIFRMKYIPINNKRSSDFTCAKHSPKDTIVKFYNTSFGYYDSLKWEFSNGVISYEDNPEILFNDTGFVDVKLTLYFENDSISKTVSSALYIYEDIYASFIAEQESEKFPYKLEIENNSMGEIEKYEWFLNDSLIAEGEIPDITIHDVGEFILKLKISNKYTEKIFEQKIFINNKLLNDYIILNSQNKVGKLYGEKTGFKYKFTYSDEFNNYFVNLIRYGNDNYYYNLPYKSNKYYYNTISSNILSTTEQVFDYKMIANLQPQKVPDFANSSNYSGVISLTIPINQNLINYFILSYSVFNQQNTPSSYSVLNTFLNIKDKNDNYIKERISVGESSLTPNIQYKYLDKYIIIYRRKVLFINKENYELKLSKYYFDKILKKHVAVYNDTLQLMSLESNVLTLEHYDINTENYSSKTMSYNANEEFIYSIQKDEQKFYIISKVLDKYKLIEFNNFTSEFVNSIDLEIENPTTMSFHKDNLIIYGSHNGELAYEEVINNIGFLYTYSGITGTFLDAESNQDNQFLAQVNLDGIEKKLFLLLMDYQQQSSVEKNNSSINLVISDNEIIIPFNNYNIEIYNLLGKKINSENNKNGNYNFSYLEQGIYLYKLKHNNTLYSSKFMVE